MAGFVHGQYAGIARFGNQARSNQARHRPRRQEKDQLIAAPEHSRDLLGQSTRKGILPGMRRVAKICRIMDFAVAQTHSQTAGLFESAASDGDQGSFLG